MELEVKTTNVFDRHRKANSRIVVHQGGGRSSKTTSILQMCIIDALDGGERLKELAKKIYPAKQAKETCDEVDRNGIEIDIIRKTMPSLRGSAMKDFFDLLRMYDLYRQQDHEKTANIYHLRNTNFNFIGLDDEQKVRGRKRTIAFMNEANECSEEDFKQIAMRTAIQVILDYNPSDETHWIYDKVLTRSDCTFIKSTIFDNPFAPAGVVAEILKYKETDENDWMVFGLGERGHRRETIYDNWDVVDNFPSNKDTFYGVDFGFTDPTVLLKIANDGEDIWIQQLVYEGELGTNDLIKEMWRNEVSPLRKVYADASAPDRIKDLNMAGFDCVPSITRDVQARIAQVKKYRVHIVNDSVETIRDFRHYCWQKDRMGYIKNGEPNHNFSHAPDAAGYAILSHLGRLQPKVVQFL